MQLINMADLDIGPRQREKITPEKVRQLKESIRSIGLLHPPTAWWNRETDRWVLVAGESRLTALRELHNEKANIIYDGRLIDYGQIPVNIFAEVFSALDRYTAELEENTHRADLTWQEVTKALAAIHRMRQVDDPQTTVAATAREVLSSQPTAAAGITHPTNMRQKIADALVIADNMDIPAVANARTMAEARTMVYRRIEEQALAALAVRKMASPESPIELKRGDLVDILPTIADDTVDLVIADPPYGIGVSGQGYSDRTVVHHHYEDTPENAKRLQLSILIESWRLCRSRANIFMFNDIRNWEWWHVTASNLGWVPFPRPIVWLKSDSEGLAPWGAKGPRICTEYIFYATKGQRGLLASPIDWLRIDRVPRRERIHGGEKPVELVRKLIEWSTLPTDLVLDPCMGSGSTMIACQETNRRGIGIELDPTYFTTAEANLYRKGEFDGQSSNPAA